MIKFMFLKLWKLLSRKEITIDYKFKRETVHRVTSKGKKDGGPLTLRVRNK